jgi:hypothetical protein
VASPAVASGVHTGGDPTAAGGAARPAASVPDRVAAPVTWLDRLFLSRRILSDLQRDVTKLLWAQAEILVKLRELKTMTVVVAKPGDRGAALAELWQLRDQFSVTDPDLAARLHAIYNDLVVAHPNEDSPEGSDGT